MLHQNPEPEAIQAGWSFCPYPHQQTALKHLFARNYKRGMLVWSRRSGKDLTLLNYAVIRAVQAAGTYWLVYPTYSQGRKILWEGILTDGTRYLDQIPDALVVDKNEQEMRIRLRTADGRESILQVIGSDNPDRIVGTNPLGAIFSEAALQNPRAKALLEPIFLANGGWALYASTPRGRNWFYDLYKAALKEPDRWYTSVLDCTQTIKWDGTPIISQADIETLRREGEDEDIIQQEYYVSWEGHVQGSYYSTYLRDARNADRIGTFEYNSKYPVRTAWDIGMNDTTVIWFYQKIGSDIRLIDHYENNAKGAEHYAEILSLKPWHQHYDLHMLPFDVGQSEWGGGKTRLASLSKEFERRLAPACRHIRVVPKWDINDGISAVRRMFPRFQFNFGTCEDGLGALSFYHKEFDEKTQAFRNKPDHDWSSNTADALRYLAVGEHDQPQGFRRQVRADSAWNPFEKEESQFEQDGQLDTFGAIDR